MEAAVHRRHGTRLRAQIPVRISSLDSCSAFSESCHTLLINPLGCGVRLPRSLKPGTRLRIDDLPGRRSITGRVASNIPPERGSRYWIVGIGWDTPGNLCGLSPVPEDWAPYATVRTGVPASRTAQTASRSPKIAVPNRTRVAPS